MEDKETILFGIPVPSDDPVFLGIVAIHILLGLICTISGLIAMFTQKGKKPHAISGKVYFWGMTALFGTILITSLMRWPFNNHLLVVGTLAYGSTAIGRQLARNHSSRWTRKHTIFMGASYILLMTGFYIDNAKNLPFWNQFPQWVFWILPSLIGIPLISKVLATHPLNKS